MYCCRGIRTVQGSLSVHKCSTPPPKGHICPHHTSWTVLHHSIHNMGRNIYLFVSLTRLDISTCFPSTSTLFPLYLKGLGHQMDWAIFMYIDRSRPKWASHVVFKFFKGSSAFSLKLKYFLRLIRAQEPTILSQHKTAEHQRPANMFPSVIQQVLRHLNSY